MKPMVLTVIGARPQFIKAASVSRVLQGRSDISEFLVHTGQHFDANMSDIFFEELGIPVPDANLGIHGSSHGEMTGRMLEGIEALLLEHKPQAVLVYGDTNSTLAGALAAAKLHIPVAHVEAGLRSFNRRMPEEINRVLTDHLSAALYCPTGVAVENLAREGITSGVSQVGDVMYDAALYAAERVGRGNGILARLGLEAGKFALTTIHRAENTDTPEALERVIRYVGETAAEAGLEVILPLHPRTAKLAEAHGLGFGNFRICAPVSYLDMAELLRGSALVLTDSGGLQKEAYFHRRPCITLRGETEWLETVDAGWNRLWTDDDWAPQREITDYGDGTAAERVVAGLLTLVG